MKLIKLTKGMCAIVDDEDFERVSKFRWCASDHGKPGSPRYYAIRAYRKDGRQVRIRLHHFILGITPSDIPPGFVVDHHNENSLDCRKENLKIITHMDNMQKSPGWKIKGFRESLLPDF